jgi:hypothetical protein
MFTVHGSWKIEVNNNVLLQWFEGSWNEEAAITYIEEFRKTTSPLVGKPWAILSVFEEWELGAPEIEKHIIEHAAWFIANGCTRDCHVYTQDILKTMQLDKMIPLKEGDYERRIFGDFQESVQWLKSNGFELNSSDFLQQLSNGESPSC